MSEFEETPPEAKRRRKRRELEYLGALITIEAQRHPPAEDVEKRFVMLT